MLLLATSLASCAEPNPRALAEAQDRRYQTGVFAWLVEHEPSSVVAWHVSPALLRTLLPAAVVNAARGEHPCAQAARAHAALVVVEPPERRTRRDYALNCGFSLYRDDAAVVVAPLP